MSLLDRIKERTGSDLPDAELSAILLSVAAELDARLGPVGPHTIEIGELDEPEAIGQRTLRISPPIGAGAVTVTEYSPANSGAPGDAIELTADDYRVLHGGRTLQRLVSGPNGRSCWAPLVKVTYTPAGPSQALRDEAAIKLALIDLSYRGGVKSERAGDYQITLSGDPAADREAILRSLVPAGGLVMA